MSNEVYRIEVKEEFERAGATDLIRMLPVPGGHPLFIEKWQLEVLTAGIVNASFVHISGPTGTAKSAVIEALHQRPENFAHLCRYGGYEAREIALYPIEMAIFETPGELYQRRALRDGATYDEKSVLVQALEKAAGQVAERYPVIWLREMGRVHSSAVQGGLLNLMTPQEIALPDGARIPGGRIAWLADSNYQAEGDSTHTLVVLDDALARRFAINLTMDYLSAEQEEAVVTHILEKEREAASDSTPVDRELVRTVVKLGQVVRERRSEGALQSVAPPTIFGYLGCLRLAHALPHMAAQQLALVTLLGNASDEDRKHAVVVLNEVLGLHVVSDEEPASGGNLF